MLVTGKIDRVETSVVTQPDGTKRVWLWVDTGGACSTGPFAIERDLLATLDRAGPDTVLHVLVGREVAIDYETVDEIDLVTRLRFGPFENTAEVVPLRPPLTAVDPDPLDDKIREMLEILDGLRTRVAAGEVSALACVLVTRYGGTRTAWSTKRGMAALAMAGAVHRFAVELGTSTVTVNGSIPGGETIG